MSQLSELIRFKGLVNTAWYFGTFLLSVIICLLLVNTSKSFDRWEQIRQRHRFFYFWNLFVIFMVVFWCSAGMFQNPQDDGVQIALMFIMCNYYVIFLQFGWRFSDTKAPEIEKDVPAKEELKDYASEQQSVSKVEIEQEGPKETQKDNSLEMQPYAFGNEERSHSEGN